MEILTAEADPDRGSPVVELNLIILVAHNRKWQNNRLEENRDRIELSRIQAICFETRPCPHFRLFFIFTSPDCLH
jgi:hypothetical protein